MLKFLIATTIWKRPEVFEMFVKNNKKYADILAVGSEGAISRDLANNLGVFYSEVPNRPFGRKLNERIKWFLKNKQYTHIILLGSDDIISDNIFLAIKKHAEIYDLISWKDLYFYDLKSENIFYCNGYKKGRDGEPFAPGRCISRGLIEQLGEELWDNDINSTPDKNIWINKLKDIKNQIQLSCKDFDGYIIDIKTSENNTPYEVMKNATLSRNPSMAEKKEILNIINPLKIKTKKFFLQNPTNRTKILSQKEVDHLINQNEILDKKYNLNIKKFKSFKTKPECYANMNIIDAFNIYKNCKKHEIFLEDQNLSKITLSVGIPLFRAQDIAWVALESLANQINIDFNWELIIIEESFEHPYGLENILLYSERLKTKGCKRIVYMSLNEWLPLSAKWFFLIKECSNSSKIFAMNSADIYCSRVRLSYQHKILTTTDKNWYKIMGNMVYDIGEDILIKIDLDKSRNDTCCAAMRMELARKLPLACIKANVDSWRYKTLEQGNISSYLDYSTEMMNETININGINNLSLKRTEKIKQINKEKFKNLLLIKNYLPKYICLKLFQTKNKILLHNLNIKKSNIKLK
jgi:hypothetical protein